MTLCGYHPTRFRPYETPDSVRVAAIWQRDGLRCRWLCDRTPEEISTENISLRKEGFRPLDVAFYDTNIGNKRVGRYAALWAQDCLEFEDSVMFVGVPQSKHFEAYAPLLAKFVPLTDVKDEVTGPEALYSSVRWKLKKYPWVINNETGLEDFKQLSAHAWYQADVRIVKTISDEIKFAGLWWPGMEYETRTSSGLSPDEHRREFQRFCDDGFRPQSITVSSVCGESRLTTASVWRRPTVAEDDADGLAKRQANAALAIARLGKLEILWPLLELKSDPTLRSHLINRIQALGIPVDEIMNRLQSLQTESGESVTSQRRALLIALSEFTLSQFSPDRQALLLKEIESLYRTDQDPGVHSAAEVVLRNWRHIDLARQIDKELQQADAELQGKLPPERRWYVTASEQTMAVVPSFEEWKMGSPGHEPMRIQHMELLHPKLLKRQIAVSTKEVTIRQFLHFFPEHDFAQEYTATDDCPINMVTWFDAAKYCRLLSERERIPVDQMCYPPIEEIKSGMKMPDNYLQRTGYRLLTEAEWEFMCRAGTTSSRYFGDSLELLNRYAFTAQNSGYVASPVGSLLPNDFGLFDMLGNAYEWCQNPTGDPYLPPPFGTEPLNDPEELGEITADSVRTLRGGSFLYQPSDSRSAHRYRYEAAATTPFLSFRIARTVTE